MNYFNLFNFIPSFDIDTGLLAERYRELQKAVHPDKFANDSEQQKLLAVQRTAQVNDGYHTLKQPLRRAEHLLSLGGVDLSHETTTVKDTAFLMQQMDWREALEDIKHSKQPQAQIDELYDSFSAHEKLLFSQLSHLLQTQDEVAYLKAADQVRKLKFMAKLQQELTHIEDALLD
ncbi:co-chaperone HscB [Shewanella sp. SR44-3]|uniref:co-chaperone HscB n=1 Tax=Shewanella sp. SR44-3 TaxID=2760936 RepID=UPI0015FD2AA5|nr:co-chaperone HscB [Shewanella sp. SR44-3]MBB1269909.1 co-chaperone HscB [Shewanella sp. SR44-3]